MSDAEEREPFNPDKAGRVYPVLFTAGLAAACGLFLAALALATDEQVEANKKAKRNRCVLFSFGSVVQTYADSVSLTGDIAALGEGTVDFAWKHCYDSRYQPPPKVLDKLYNKYIERVGFYEVPPAQLHETHRTGDFPLRFVYSDTSGMYILVEKKVVGDQTINVWCKKKLGDQNEAPYFEYYTCRDGGEIKGYSLGVGGPGFWEPIFGFLALEPDLYHIIGLSIFLEKDTPGLGGKCDEPEFLYQFTGKLVTEALPNGDYKLADIGQRVIAPENTGRAEFQVSKGGIQNANQVAAITGASETSNAMQSIVNKNLNQNLPLLRAVLDYEKQQGK